LYPIWFWVNSFIKLSLHVTLSSLSTFVLIIVLVVVRFPGWILLHLTDARL
jgi:hypothetical protein